MNVYAYIQDGNLRVGLRSEPSPSQGLQGTIVRIFPLDNLPDCLRLQLAMVHAFDWEPILEVMKDWRNTVVNKNVCPIWYPKECKHIGWMLSKTEYILILPDEAVDKLLKEPPYD